MGAARADVTPPGRVRSGGRSERVRLAVAEAVLALLEEGRPGFSVAEVAERAGVHRTTVYRWWPTPAALLREALTLHTARLVVPDTGCWADDVFVLAAELAAFFSDPVEMAMNAVMSSGADPEMDKVQLDNWVPIFEDIAKVVERAKRRGDVIEDTDAGIVLRLLTGPLLVHTVLLHEKPDAELVRSIAKAVARAFAPMGEGNEQRQGTA